MKSFIVKIRIVVKDGYEDNPNIRQVIEENVSYPYLLPDYMHSKEIISWQEFIHSESMLSSPTCENRDEKFCPSLVRIYMHGLFYLYLFFLQES